MFSSWGGVLATFSGGPDLVLTSYSCFSDVSSLCFAATYVSGQNKTMNYFSCKDCNLKCKVTNTKEGCVFEVFQHAQGYVSLVQQLATESTKHFLSSQIINQHGKKASHNYVANNDIVFSSQGLLPLSQKEKGIQYPISHNCCITNIFVCSVKFKNDQ